MEQTDSDDDDMSIRLGGLAWLVVGAVLLGVPVGVLVALLLSQEQLAGLSQTPAALVEPIHVVEYDGRTGVVATLSWIGGPKLYAPAWSGIVGQVQLQPGTVRTGDAVATVDGIRRLAVASPQPFYRTLALDDEGPDVAWLHDVLVVLGYLEQPPTDSAQVTPATVRAVGDMAADLGVIGSIDAFDPTWFVWLPMESFEVVSVELTAGAPAPPNGTPIAAGAPLLSALALQRVDGPPLTLEPGVPYVLELAGEDLTLDNDTATVDEAGLVRLAAVLPPLLESGSGSVRRAEPLVVWSLPSAAVMSGSGGQLCIWTEAGGQYEAVPVEVVAGRAGVTFLRPPAASANVLQNPAEILAEPACPST
jgi:hypothetical protein